MTVVSHIFVRECFLPFELSLSSLNPELRRRQYKVLMKYARSCLLFYSSLPTAGKFRFASSLEKFMANVQMQRFVFILLKQIYKVFNVKRKAAGTTTGFKGLWNINETERIKLSFILVHEPKSSKLLWKFLKLAACCVISGEREKTNSIGDLMTTSFPTELNKTIKFWTQIFDIDLHNTFWLLSKKPKSFSPRALSGIYSYRIWQGSIAQTIASSCRKDFLAKEKLSRINSVNL